MRNEEGRECRRSHVRLQTKTIEEQHMWGWECEMEPP